MNTPKKEYILWTYSDGGYHPTEYDTLEECLLADKYGDWYVTRSINDLSIHGHWSSEKAKKQALEL
ncbi:hypothetical protein [Nitrosomonas sp.]|uniref:hypothetical protein n=1 Tax=Nitrosomonas sp. TaxID=42353 RepID=UPI0032EB8464